MLLLHKITIIQNISAIADGETEAQKSDSPVS